MGAWLDRFYSKKTKSADQAKDRLKLVLIHDRTDMSPDTLEHLKNELIDVISRYVSIDPYAVKISMAQEGRQQRLVADIPIKSSGRRMG